MTALERRTTTAQQGAYRSGSCPNCGRDRVLAQPPRDGVCEKCEWDVNAGVYARVSRPALFEVE